MHDWLVQAHYPTHDGHLIASVPLKPAPGARSLSQQQYYQKDNLSVAGFMMQVKIISWNKIWWCNTVVCLFVSAAYGLKCYQCSSLKSWDDCKTNRKLMTCPSAADRCVESHTEATAANVTVTAYVIGCSTSAACNRDCNDLPLANITKCEFDCCSGDLCNGAIPTPKPRLKCYQCFSLKSWADCAANKREVTCPSGADHCGTAHVEAQVVGVSKAAYNAGCFTSAACSRDIFRISIPG